MSKKRLSITPKLFQKAILTWFDQHGRKELPWQKNKSAYRVWVSEIMLQQTQVNTVIPYFLRFIEIFPNVSTLAAAAEDQVLHLWSGLGYYSRARNLLRTAKLICTEYQGQVPSNLLLLQQLPGIGKSTAGAIAAIAFEKKAAILDGNVKRVLTRFLGIQEWPGEKNVIEKLWQVAEHFTPHKRVADYTQAMMDLGATICVRSKPQCPVCPLKKYCIAHTSGLENKLPQSKPHKIIPIRESIFLLLQENQFVLLKKLPPEGVWANLWSFPQMEKLDEKKIAGWFHFEIKKIKTLPKFRHTFSHFHLDISPVLITGKRKKNIIQENNQYLWYDLKNPAAVGLPAPVKKLLKVTSDQHYDAALNVDT